jgi:uncharacterized protein
MTTACNFMDERFVVRVLRQYKRWISPLLPPACRYVPSCSEYAAEAVARHGVARGSLLAAWRLVRCNPFVKGGYDPVPESCEHASRTEVRPAERT